MKTNILKIIIVLVFASLLMFPSAIAKDITEDIDPFGKIKTDKELKIKSYFKDLLKINEVKYEKELYTQKGSSVYVFRLVTESKTYLWITTKNKYDDVTK